MVETSTLPNMRGSPATARRKALAASTGSFPAITMHRMPTNRPTTVASTGMATARSPAFQLDSGTGAPPHHQQTEALLGGLVARHFGHNLPLVHHQDPVCQVHDLIQLQ